MIPSWLLDDPRVVHVDRSPAVAAVTGSWPSWAPAGLLERLAAAGITQPWRHQVEAAQALRDGQHVALATGTASGKSLAYLLPILAATWPWPEPTRLTWPLPRPPRRRGRRVLAPPLPGQEPLPGLEDEVVLAWVPPDPGTTPSQRPEKGAENRSTALYLAPTKALAHDQLRACQALGPSGWRITAVDGDSCAQERRFARELATCVLTNPDLLHRSVLPNHARWRSFLSRLGYVVVDEAHRYRGVFGAQVALVLRRLRRLCARYGAEPTFAVVSATAGEGAAEAAARLLGEEPSAVTPVTWDCAPHGERTTLLWRPTASAEDETAELLARLVADDRQTLAFVGSRRAAEVVARKARQGCFGEAGADRARAARSPAPTVAAYRSGYLARDRRSLEQGLRDGSVRGVATTSALELGVDLAGVDAVVVSGFPGSVASFRQQSGRAGRGTGEAVTVLVAREDPLDAYLFEHPELILREPVEAAVLDPANPAVLGPQLGAAAQELPLTEADERWFGPAMHPVLHRLVEHGTLRRRAKGWYWCHRQRAVDAVDLRSGTTQPVEIIESATGRVVGSTDTARAHRSVHPGAVYLHQGEHWEVERLDEEAGEAWVRAVQPSYSTHPLSSTSVTVLADQTHRGLGQGEVHRGTVEIVSQVTGYLVRDLATGEVTGRVPLDLPSRTLRTQSTWFTLPPSVTPRSGRTSGEERLAVPRLKGPLHRAEEDDRGDSAAAEPRRIGRQSTQRYAAAHAVEHTLLGLLPTFAHNDRSDTGGASFAQHLGTGALTVLIYDVCPGGSGFAAAGYARAEDWASAALSRLERCGCTQGCPRCCVWPGCPTANDAIDKQAAIQVLHALVC